MRANLLALMLLLYACGWARDEADCSSCEASLENRAEGINETLWYGDFAPLPRERLNDKDPKWVFIAARSGNYRDDEMKITGDVCHLLRENINSQGGAVILPCASITSANNQSIDPRFEGKEIELPFWREMKAEDGLRAIKANYDGVCVSRKEFAKRMATYPEGAARGMRVPEVDECWEEVRPIFELLLKENRLVVQSAQVDIDNDLEDEQVVRYAVRNRDECRNSNERTAYLWRYAMDGDGDLSTFVNAKALRGRIFLYKSPDIGVETLLLDRNGAVVSGQRFPATEAYKQEFRRKGSVPTYFGLIQRCFFKVESETARRVH